MGKRTLALVGNPNVGKTVLFNSICRANERVGNWHGVTTERKIYSITYKNEAVDIVDLPGCYNLSGYSLEERETATFLKGTSCDIVNICDPRQLERNLYLTLLLLEQNQRVILFLNDYAKSSPKIDINNLNRLLGVEILSKTAARTNLDEVMLKDFYSCRPKYYDNNFKKLPQEKQIEIRYQYINDLIKSCVVQKQKSKFDFDKIFLGKFSFLSFALICLGIFYICFGGVGSFLTEFLQNLLQNKIVLPVNNFLERHCSELLTSFICDGVLSACLGLICFLPQIMLVSFFINILQDCGYLSRMAFLFDGMLCRVGLSGKAIFSLLISFGCNTTALLTTGGQEDEKDKIILSLCLPFVCCSAKLPVFVIFTHILSSSFGFLFTVLLYLITFLIGIFVIGIINKLLKKNENKIFILELGNYKLPNLKSAIKESIISAKNFLLKIGTIVFVSNVIVWGLQTFDFSFQVNKQNSMLKSIATFLSPIFAPIGLNNYGVVAALIVGVLAKELIITTIAIINGISTSGLGLCLNGGLVINFSSLTLFIFLVFVALYSPCISYLFGVKKSLGRKNAYLSCLGMTAIAYIVCMVIYFYGKLYLLSIEIFIWSMLGIAFITSITLLIKNKRKCLYCANKNCSKCPK